MGQIASYIYGDSLPTPIPCSSLAVERENANPAQMQHQTQLCNDLQTRGYAILKMPELSTQVIESTKTELHKFFAGVPLEEKLKIRLPPRDDPLLRMRPNRGYVSGNIKEFLKIRTIAADDGLFPAGFPELETNFRGALQAMRKHTLDAFLRIHENNPNNESFKDTVMSFFDEGSSLSVIRYYKLADQPNFESAPKEYKDEDNELAQAIDSSTHLALAEHKDTGLLTFILVGSVPGLEVWDPILNRFICVEKEVDTGHGVLIMGRKFELFSNQYKATLHRVVIDKQVERYSALYFMDLPSGPNNM